MSIRALSWVVDQEYDLTSTQKYVLTAMANYCNDKGLSYPGIKTICHYTLLHEDTVSKALSALEMSGYIKDTGETKGATGRTKVYQMPEPCWEIPRKTGVLNSGISGQCPINARLIPVSVADPNIKEPVTKNQELQPSPKSKQEDEDTHEAVALWIQAYNENSASKYVSCMASQMREDSAAMKAILKAGLNPQEISDTLRKAFETAKKHPNEKEFWNCNHISRIKFFAERLNEINAEIAKRDIPLAGKTINPKAIIAERINKQDRLKGLKQRHAELEEATHYEWDARKHPELVAEKKVVKAEIDVLEKELTKLSNTGGTP